MHGANHRPRRGYLIITDLCVFEVKPDGGGLVLIELHPGVTVDDVRAKTGAPFDVSLKR